MKNTLLMIALILCICPGPGFSAGGSKEADKAPLSVQTQSQGVDEKAIRSSAEEFVAAFNKGDSKGIGALWTKDCEYVDETGRLFKGRDAIEKEYSAFFSANPGLKMETAISSIKIVGSHAATENGTAIVKKADGTVVSRASYTALHLKQGDKWLMASVREYAPRLSSSRTNLENLEFLIGDWSAAKDSKSLNFSAKWIADKKFIELSYSVRDKDTQVRSGLQIIGRNPSSGEIVSWSFDSTGGHGQGEWSILKRGILIQSRGVMPDGSPTRSRYIVSVIDSNNLSWQSVDQRVAGQKLNDTEPVVLKRKSK